MRLNHIRQIAKSGPYKDPKLFSIKGLAFTPNADQLFVSDWGTRRVHVWDTASGALVEPITVGLEDANTFTLTTLGDRVLTLEWLSEEPGPAWERQPTLRIWDLAGPSVSEVAVPKDDFGFCPRMTAAADGTLAFASKDEIQLGRLS